MGNDAFLPPNTRAPGMEAACRRAGCDWPILRVMRLTRPIQPMPEDIARRLDAAHLRDPYEARPPYQRNDYLGWIARAKRPETRDKRIAQMLEELAAGDRYMKMAWRQRP